ncbi:MAG: nuclear transport factor 2 family protein [Candidatus Baltobacteraceae bacterium]
MKRCLDAHARADFATFASAFHLNATWTLAPAGVLKGNYRGRDQILGFFAHLAHETGGTFASTATVLAAATDRVFALKRATARRGGMTAEWDAVLLFTLVDERISAVRHYLVDHAAFARFWTYNAID